MGFVTLEIELWPVLWFGVTCVGCFCMWDDFRGRPVADASFAFNWNICASKFICFSGIAFHDYCGQML